MPSQRKNKRPPGLRKTGPRQRGQRVSPHGIEFRFNRLMALQ
jgi:hypothetical protein